MKTTPIPVALAQCAFVQFFDGLLPNLVTTGVDHGFSMCDRDRKVVVRYYDVSQRSLHIEPIFRLLLKVAVRGTH